MSGNRTYIGPFGRLLPIPDDHEEPESILGPMDETRSSTMGTYNLPRPALDFGSDNRGFTDPLRYSSQRSAPPTKRHDQNDPSGEHPRAIDHESLPGVDQLLTPATHSSIPPSPYPPYQSPKQRSSLSAGQPEAAQLSRMDASQTYCGNHQSFKPPPVPQFSHQFASERDSYTRSFPAPLAPPPLPQTYVPSTSPIPPPYSAYPGQAHQVPYLPQGPPQATAPMGHALQQQQASHQASAVQHYVDAPSTSNVSANLAGSSERSEKSVDNPLKLQPRVVREDVLPGEGPVWVYDDGSTCPKVIDGEPVNAEWGVTKAGKPRKRLALACTTCREKKIKCQPAFPKCALCDKFGRECHYATAPRIQYSTPKTPSYEFQARHKPVMIKHEPHNRVLLPSTIKPEKNEDHLVKRRNLSPENHNVRPIPHQTIPKQPKKPPYKKQRSDPLPSVKDADIRATPDTKSRGKETLSTATAPCEEDLSSVSLMGYKWCTNPYDVDAKVISHYVEMYFVHVNAAGHRLFPHRPFVHWLENNESKSPDDIMLIYSILALGSIFSARRHHKTDGHLFVNIARCAVEKSQHKFSLQLIQSRTILGLYYFAIGESQGGWDFVGQGLRAALGLRLNIEEHCRDARHNEEQPFGLHKYAVIECCRRTYWSAYIADRCGVLHPDHLPMLQSQDIFLRLPCDEDIYCRQKASNAPFFNNDLYRTNTGQAQRYAAVGPMAYLVDVSAIWGDVLTFNHRHARDAAGEYASSYEKYYREILRRLSDWKTSLPKDLEYTSSNVYSSIESGTIGLFLEIHALYHTVILKLNRILRRDISPPISCSRNFNKARKQALELLKMMEAIASAIRSSKNPLDTSGNFPEFSDEALKSCSPLAGSSAFAGYAALLAVDILSAGGCVNLELFKNLISSMKAGLTIVDELSQCWTSAIEQKKTMWGRLESLCGNVTNKAASVKVWRHRTALDPALHSGQDLFYNDAEHARDTFFDYLEINVEEDQVLYID